MKISRIAWFLVAAAAGVALFVHSHEGATETTHSVTLNWNPSACAASYNVYRGTKSGGPYGKIGSAAKPSYVDAPVSSGSVFYYVVTVVCNGKESAYSQEIKAAVP